MRILPGPILLWSNAQNISWQLLHCSIFSVFLLPSQYNIIDIYTFNMKFFFTVLLKMRIDIFWLTRCLSIILHILHNRPTHFSRTSKTYLGKAYKVFSKLGIFPSSFFNVSSATVEIGLIFLRSEILFQNNTFANHLCLQFNYVRINHSPYNHTHWYGRFHATLGYLYYLYNHHVEFHI